MIINMTYSEVNKLHKKLDTWEMEKVERFLISMPKVGLILDNLNIAMLELDPDKVYKKMLEIYKNDNRALKLINETIKGNLYYRQ